ncbi:MAG: SDR family oxidoreductase [Elusimicrobiaceae bacterium]|jgi:dTDP-4-dehydrorhamnose reductase
MKILIIGASGQVGGALLGLYRGDPSVEVLGTYHSYKMDGLVPMDITDPASVRGVFDSFRPDAAVLASAISSADYCEQHPQAAFGTNVRGTENVINFCNAYRVKPVYISTDYIFDGTGGPYNEEAQPNPINVYGKTKLEGEKAVASSESGHLIVRTALVFSYNPVSLNFMMSLINCLAASSDCPAPVDQISNPTYAPDLARALRALIDKNCSGIYNVVGRDRLSRYDFALKACTLLGLDKRFLRGVETAELKQAAARPLFSGLDTAKLIRDTGHNPMMVSEALSLIARLRAGKE